MRGARKEGGGEVRRGGRSRSPVERRKRKKRGRRGVGTSRGEVAGRKGDEA